MRCSGIESSDVNEVTTLRGQGWGHDPRGHKTHEATKPTRPQNPGYLARSQDQASRLNITDWKCLYMQSPVFWIAIVVLKIKNNCVEKNWE